MHVNSRLRYLTILFVFFSVCFLVFRSFGLLAADNQKTGSQVNSKESKEYNVNTEDHYRATLTRLDRLTPLSLGFNPDVQKNIERYVKNQQRDLATYIGRSDFYFPIIEQTLDRYDLPLELKYMAVIESGLNPTARSRSGALGVWQFLYNTAKLFNLQISSYIDERCDPVISTDAACRYLSYLFQTFNDWNLVLAAYNGGPGEVRKAIERSGGKTDYWEIRPYLSEQAKNYVPAFIAMNYLFEAYDQHNIVPLPFKFTKSEIDSIHLNYSLSFHQISNIINLSTDDLALINPVYRKKHIPQSNKTNALYLPKNKVKTFIIYENEIRAETIENPDYLDLLNSAGSTENRSKVIHEVKTGEYFHMIALKYNCTIENIKAWNQLEDAPLHRGQKIVLWLE